MYRRIWCFPEQQRICLLLHQPVFREAQPRFERSDILATLEADAVPKWAQEKLCEALQSQQKKDKAKEAAR